MNQNERKKAAAEAAIAHIPPGAIVGVGTGSTANHFIDALAGIRSRIEAAVASSEVTASRLKAQGIPVLDLNTVDEMPVYVDGADEITRHLAMIKGGGGALTREKIVGAVARRFICIADESKLVDVLGNFPLPVEVIPMARSHVARELAKPTPRLAALASRLQQLLAEPGRQTLEMRVDRRRIVINFDFTTELRTMIGDRPIRLEMDGGISVRTAAAAVRAGADTLVAGSAVFGQADRAAAIAALRAAARSA